MNLVTRMSHPQSWNHTKLIAISSEKSTVIVEMCITTPVIVEEQAVVNLALIELICYCFSELDEALLVLPFSFVMDFLRLLNEWIMVISV